MVKVVKLKDPSNRLKSEYDFVAEFVDVVDAFKFIQSKENVREFSLILKSEYV